jgi:c-di-GMP-binding flagellar brake protein YcgR
MTAETSRITHPEAHFTEEESQFLVRAPQDVTYILRSALAKSAMVTAYFEGEGGFAITSLLEVSPESDELIFDVPAQPHLTGRLLASPQITFVTSQSGVKIKFQVEGAAPKLHDGRPALAARMPTAVLRLQRRESFRVACPISTPVKCTIPFNADGKAQRAELVALDISQGGIGLINMHHSLNLEQRVDYKDCVVSLPGVGSFTTTLEVRSAQQVTLKNGQTTMRAGCRYRNPENGALAMVHRYTQRLERERGARF